MHERIHYHWLPWILFRFFLMLAGFLILLILLCPFLDDGRANPDRSHRLIAIMARDLVIRRTAIAGSAGIAATAWIFFRSKPECDVPGSSLKEKESIQENDL
jgi:hypothetical protein